MTSVICITPSNILKKANLVRRRDGPSSRTNSLFDGMVLLGCREVTLYILKISNYVRCSMASNTNKA